MVTILSITAGLLVSGEAVHLARYVMHMRYSKSDQESVLCAGGGV